MIYTLLMLLWVPLPILDARIKAYQHQLTNVNLSVTDRRTLGNQLAQDMRARYCILEDLAPPDVPASPLECTEEEDENPY